MAFTSVPTLPGLSLQVQALFGSTQTDIQADLLEFSTDLATTRGSLIYGPGSGVIRLNNADNRYTNTNGSSPYTGYLWPGTLISITARYNSIDYDVMVYLADEWSDDPVFVVNGVSNGWTVTTVPGRQPTALLSDWRGVGLGPIGGGQSTADRVSGLLTTASWPYGSSLTGTLPMQQVDWTKDLWSHIVDAAKVEGSPLYCTPDGELWMPGRYKLLSTASTVSQCTLGPGAGEVPYLASQRPKISTGIELMCTQASVTNAGQTTQYATDTTYSNGRIVAINEQQLGLSEISAKANAEAIVLRKRQPIEHPTSVSIFPAADPTVAWPQALGRKLFDRVTVKVPRSNGTTRTVDCLITGIHHQASPPTGWVTTWDLEPAVFSAGDYGAWGSGAWGTFKWAW